jgi:hypothetical protein
MFRPDTLPSAAIRSPLHSKMTCPFGALGASGKQFLTKRP